MLEIAPLWERYAMTTAGNARTAHPDFHIDALEGAPVDYGLKPLRGMSRSELPATAFPFLVLERTGHSDSRASDEFRLRFREMPSSLHR
jgi:hypothetical protein